MALISIIPDFHPLQDARLLERAAQLTPRLRETLRRPVALRAPAGEQSPPDWAGLPGLGRGDSLCLDFGGHMVGYVSLDLSAAGSHQDAPALLRLKFAENLQELAEDAANYDGWLSRSWIQEEILHVDLLPTRLDLPRRYAFRYLEITVLDTSPKYRLRVDGALCRAVSAADWANVSLPALPDPRLEQLRAVGLRTLAECMQEVFEDGPKRDRRLWLGDLRLQALTNSVSFRCFDLVKRCLYLFAGSRFPDGRVSACVFTEPEPEADDTYLLDYALLYPVILEEYLEQTGDPEALEDLYLIAMDQLAWGLSQCEGDLVRPQAAKDAFLDWCDELDRQASAQGCLIYALGYGAALARRKGDLQQAEALLARRAALRTAAGTAFWDEARGCFLSNGQRSAASQIWMVLADVPDREQARRALEGLEAFPPEVSMGTPYLHHYYVEALLRAGLRDRALTRMKEYWGGMLDQGADTFWECWDPQDPKRSPYGGTVVNSYCHAWSCTPAYFIAREFTETERKETEDHL